MAEIIKTTKYDIAVIGGGPAGLMAAGRAADLGASVVLIEKNKTLGAKLLLTGGGRCNLTNDEPDVRQLIKHYGESGKFLIPLFYAFGVTETLKFFRKHGVKTKVEPDGRIFPTTDKADTVLQCLIDYVEAGGVQIITDEAVQKVELENGTVKITSTTEEIFADKIIVATGGGAAPLTGSNADMFQWLRKFGHKISAPKPALVPIKIKEKFIKDLVGASLDNVEIKVGQIKKVGSILFTHFGLSGPAVLNVSEHTEKNKEIKIDFFPETTAEELDQRLLLLINENPNKKLLNALSRLIPEKLANVMLKQLKIDAAKKANSLTKQERLQLLALMKQFTLHVSGNLGLSQAMYSRGGIDLSEVNPRKMQSKLIPNLYFAGDVLDIERECGGYSLQMCWTTGYIAGESAP